LSSTAGATDGPHGNSKQSFIASIDDQMEASVGQFVGATEGEVADGTQHLGALLDAMIEAGVQADGVPEKEWGSVMTMAVLADGELTPVRRSKRNVDVADVDSLEKAEKRVAVKNLEGTQGKPFVNSVCAFSNIHIEKNLGGLGITLGDNDVLIQESITFIKDIERDRLTPSNVVNLSENKIDGEEDEIDPDISTLSRLCGDLTEEVMDDNSVDLDWVLVNVPIKVAKSKKKKKPLDKNTVAKKKILF
jgi:hypothetical protein